MDSNKRLLVIDDKYSHLLLLQTILEEEGYKVITINNGSDALKIIEEDTNIDAILLDIMMPDIDGYQILDKLRTNGGKLPIPVIIVSAKADTNSIKKAMDKGAFGYITKPLNIQEVRNKINSALQEE